MNREILDRLSVITEEEQEILSRYVGWGGIRHDIQKRKSLSLTVGKCWNMEN